MAMKPVFWRKWHRWIGFPATIFLLFASVTGILVAWSEFFGANEELREAMRKVVSPVTLTSSMAPWAARLERAIAAVRSRTGDAPVDQVTIHFKGVRPLITIYTGKATGGEDRRFVVDATTGELLETASYVDKPFLHRLHSGEALGDGGLVMAMFWGLALALLATTGLMVYTTMWRRDRTGWRRFFW